VSLSLLSPAWSALGGAADRTEDLRLEGDPAGVLPSRLRTFDAMASSIATSLLAASELDAVRVGKSPGEVVLRCDEVALAATSERFGRRAGEPPPNLFAPLSRFFESGDRWVRLHANYPWHRQRALSVLGCADDPDAVAAAVGAWEAFDLEEALAAAGALGSVVRTPVEWEAHAQGQAVASRPLIEVVERPAAGRRFGDGRVAEGVRVLDLTRVIAGPVATRNLAAWGADVLRLDAPDLPEIDDQTIDALSGKASAILDLGRDHRRREELLGQADLLVQGYRPGALSRFGLDPDDLGERHPHLTVVTLSAWGETGPWAGRRGFDSLVQCPTGIAAIEGDEHRPGVLPAQALDHATGYLAAAAGLRGLACTQRGEPSRSARLALAATAHWLMSSGHGDRSPAREVDPAPHLVTLRGSGRDVAVIGPPGQIEGRRPGWRSTTQIGADPPAFVDSGRGSGGMVNCVP
jgi:CoA-transferase family III